jgi:hypothetical protein
MFASTEVISRKLIGIGDGLEIDINAGMSGLDWRDGIIYRVEVFLREDSNVGKYEVQPAARNEDGAECQGE